MPGNIGGGEEGAGVGICVGGKNWGCKKGMYCGPYISGPCGVGGGPCRRFIVDADR